MNRPRRIIDNLADLVLLNEDEMVEGYRDGFEKDAVNPGDNRSDSYYHGFRNGVSDRTGKTDGAQRKLVHELVESRKRKNSKVLDKKILK